MTDYTIGVVGGSGLYQMDAITILEERRLETPFGEPSDAFLLGELDGIKVAFLPRHGRGHRLMPSELNFRANIYGFKSLGVRWLISVSAVGSMKEAYEPTHLVVPDQFYDRTRHRPDTFFGDGLVAHVSMADPVCGTLAGVMAEGADVAGAT
ncbi:MAG: S-methyl-5'-thioadenosine phosphorylase, partial [Acidobacteriota bacterium]